jgi:outer membrane murein-binding lipoprotein Lpp
MPSKLDEISLAIGGLRSDVRALEKTGDQRHADNQASMGQIRADTAKSLSELRVELGRAIDGLSEITTQRYEGLAVKVDQFSEKLDAHAEEVRGVPVRLSPRTMAALISIALGFVALICWALQAGFEWFVGHVLKRMIGG